MRAASKPAQDKRAESFLVNVAAPQRLKTPSSGKAVRIGLRFKIIRPEQAVVTVQPADGLPETVSVKTKSA
jgi:hypothetical protein